MLLEQMVQPVNILTHEFAPFRGGIGVYVHETALALEERGNPTTVWAPDYGRIHQDAYPYQVKRIRMRGKQDWPCRWRMALAVRACFPGGTIPGTLILAEPGPIRLWIYHRWLGLPRPDRLVTIFHGTELKNLSGTMHRRILLGRLIEASDCVGVVSKAIFNNLMEIYPESRAKVEMIPGAVRSSWSGIRLEPLVAGFGKMEILQVGRIHPRKGQLALVEAVAQLPEELLGRIQVRLIGQVGQKEYADKVNARIQSAGLPVVVEGPLSEEALKTAYESAFMVIMPSQPYRSSVEGLGLALLEAQHFGRPVIGSRIGGIAEALRENETGILVPPGDTAALTEAIASLLRDPERAQSMGTAGARFSRESFSWQVNAGKLDTRNQLA